MTKIGNVHPAISATFQWGPIQHVALGSSHNSYGQFPYAMTGWMWNSEVVTLEEFANRAYGENTAEKTMFLLRYSNKVSGELK